VSAEDEVKLMLAKWDGLDDMTLSGLQVLRAVIDKEIDQRKHYALTSLARSMREKISRCCGDSTRFCESYGCGTLRRLLKDTEAVE
jgi:hypothetical protein